MRQSMTGFGAAECESSEYRVRSEVRSVNGRFLKVSLRVPSWLYAREHELEQRVRATLRRGSLSVNLVVEPKASFAVPRINADAVRAYQAAFVRLGLPQDHIPMLPGVVDTSDPGAPTDDVARALWDLVCQATDAALVALIEMRGREGDALAAAMLEICSDIETHAAAVRSRTPVVAQESYERISARMAAILAGAAAAVDPTIVAREIAVLAERSDVTEEVDRLAAHLAQMREFLASAGEVGRTLEFLAQEMHREVNTIGSKSADAELSRHVVDLKGAVERLREQAANLE